MPQWTVWRAVAVSAQALRGNTLACLGSVTHCTSFKHFTTGATGSARSVSLSNCTAPTHALRQLRPGSAITRAVATAALVHTSPVASSSTVLVVESPAKAQKIQNYLGSSYKVLASYGHIRDLPSKNGSVDPAANFAMTWAVAAKARPHLQAIKAALKHADRLVLATDPDREGEAIAWHLLEELQSAVKGKDVQRITFTQVSKRAVETALAAPRALSMPLIESYKGRRALDFLMGFDLSPVLWKKMVGSKSAGRVQSVALRLIAERESEVEAFQPQEWWSVNAMLSAGNSTTFPAQVTHVDGQKVDQMNLTSETAAEALSQRISTAQLQVTNIKHAESSRKPGAPFITSSMVQDAANKMGFKVANTMSTAQALFEGGDEAEGLITYIRTDSPAMDADTLQGVRHGIATIFGKEYLADDAIVYKSKNRNAQEGHGAITPVNPLCVPSAVLSSVHSGHGVHAVPSSLIAAQERLYDLIWRRTLASQMAAARLQQTSVEVSSSDGSLKLRASASQILFPGFLKALGRHSSDQSESAEGEEEAEGQSLGQQASRQQEQDRQAQLLTSLQVGQTIKVEQTPLQQHFTQGPPRYSEARLVRTLEEKGIGRPSTYAPIISTLQARGYVSKEGKALQATSRGRVLSAFLEHYFAQYVDYGFTSDMEAQLDEIAGGQKVHTDLLQQFWGPFHDQVHSSTEVPVRDIIDALDGALGSHLFLPQEGQTEQQARQCPACAQRGEEGRLGLKLSKTGGFIGCSSYPACSYQRPMELMQASSEEEQAQQQAALPDLTQGPRSLGKHPRTGEEVTLRQGRYGFYLQLGDSNTASSSKQTYKRGRSEATSGFKAKRATVKDEDAKAMTLDRALDLLKWPLELGHHPAGGLVTLHNGPFSFYLQHGTKKCPIPEEQDANAIQLYDACEMLDTYKSVRSSARRAGSKPQESGIEVTKPQEQELPDEAHKHSASDMEPVAESLAKRKTKSASRTKASSKSKSSAAKPSQEQTKGLQKEKKSAAAVRTKSTKSSSSGAKKARPKADEAGAGPKQVHDMSYREFWQHTWQELKAQDATVKLADAQPVISQAWKQVKAEKSL